MTDSSPPSSNEPKFFKGQRVFAKDETSGILYEAVIRRSMFGMTRQKQIHMHESEEEQDEKEEWHCFVHYLGWNVSWDRWVSERNIYEVTDKNRELAKKLHQAVKYAKKKHGRKSPQIMVELAQRMKQLEQERRLEERREELAKQGIVMQEEEVQVAQENTTKFTKAYFKKELALREQDLQGKRKQSHAEKLVLPFLLKKVLVEEWEVISQCGMVPTLPVDNTVTVRQVLDNYLESKIGKPVDNGIQAAAAPDNVGVAATEAESVAKEADHDSLAANDASGDSKVATVNQVAAAVETKDTPLEGDLEKDESAKKQEQEWQEMVDGIALLFDQAAASRLLYRQEVPLHEWILQHDDYGKLRYCQVYGCEHLLRLFVRLPALLADQLSDAEARPIFSKLNDFVRYLQKHQATIFQQSYQAPSEEPSRKRVVDGTANKKSSKRSRTALSKGATTQQDTVIKDPSPPPPPAVPESNGMEIEATTVSTKASCSDETN